MMLHASAGSSQNGNSRKCGRCHFDVRPNTLGDWEKGLFDYGTWRFINNTGDKRKSAVWS